MGTPRAIALRLLAALAVATLAGIAHADDAAPRPAAAPSPSAAAAPTAEETWVVIVHPSNPSRSFSRSDLERIWRRRTAFWPDGQPVLPLNLPGGTPLRRSFQADVLRADDEELALWWNRAYFQGMSPPVVLHTGAAVKAYVAVTPGAIGYIPATEADATVAVAEVDLGH